MFDRPLEHQGESEAVYESEEQHEPVEKQAHGQVPSTEVSPAPPFRSWNHPSSSAQIVAAPTPPSSPANARSETYLHVWHSSHRCARCGRSQPRNGEIAARRSDRSGSFRSGRNAETAHDGA